MGVSGFSITADRLNSVAFTIPHSTTAAQLIMLASEISKLHITNGTITSLADVKSLGLTVGTQDGTTEQQELQAAGVSMNSWDSFATAIQDMASANPSVQAVYAETPITTAWIAQYAAQGRTNQRCLSASVLPMCIRSQQKRSNFPCKVRRGNNNNHQYRANGSVESQMERLSKA